MSAPTSADLRRYAARAPTCSQDRVILVTGASGSIGGALARACARLGARVILSGRSVKKLEKRLRLDRRRRRAAAVDRAARLREGRRRRLRRAGRQRSSSEFGRLDGLAHVGALLGDRSPIAHYDVPTWLKVMHVNVNAPFILTQVAAAAARASRPTRRSSSRPAACRCKGRAYWGAYAASKFANEGLMQVLADELATDSPIRSNSVNPGAVRSPMRAKAYPGEDAAKLRRAGGGAGAVPVPAGPGQPRRHRLPLRRAVDLLRGGRAPAAGRGAACGRCRRAVAARQRVERVEIRAFERARAAARQVARQRDRAPLHQHRAADLEARRIEQRADRAARQRALARDPEPHVGAARAGRLDGAERDRLRLRRRPRSASRASPLPGSAAARARGTRPASS